MCQGDLTWRISIEEEAPQDKEETVEEDPGFFEGENDTEAEEPQHIPVAPSEAMVVTTNYTAQELDISAVSNLNVHMSKNTLHSSVYSYNLILY